VQSGPTPTTATGWLELASSQPPKDALASIRHALVLAPDWSNAQAALCAALAANHDEGATEACNVAIARRPSDVALLAARGAARLEAGHATEALADLDRLVAADPDPRWRRLRAKARTAAGDPKGAKRDLDQGCQLGDAIACRDAKLP
jgi:predicted Zn-dependent protease